MNHNHLQPLRVPEDNSENTVVEQPVPTDTAETTSECAMLQEARRRRVDDLAEVDSTISELEAKRTKLRREIAAFDFILGSTNNAESVFVPQFEKRAQLETADKGGYKLTTRRRQQSEALASSVDAVVEALREHGPLHYREIYTKVADMGVIIPGKDPASTLLSRFSRDQRVERISSGTYNLIQDVVFKSDRPQEDGSS